MKKVMTFLMATALVLLGTAIACKPQPAPAPVAATPAPHQLIPTSTPAPAACKEGSEWGLGLAGGVHCFKCIAGKAVEQPCPGVTVKPTATKPAPKPSATRIPTLPPQPTAKPKPTPKPCKEGDIVGVGIGGGVACQKCVDGKWVDDPGCN